MKNLNDIEDFLRENKPPDQSTDQTMHDVWQTVMKIRKERHPKHLLHYTRPWMWVLASFLLIGFCILMMVLMARS